MKICTQRKAGRRKRARRLCRSFILLPMDPCVSSPATRVSLACRARPCTKNGAPEEEAGFFFFKQFIYRRRLLLYEVEPWHSPEIFWSLLHWKLYCVALSSRHQWKVLQGSFQTHCLNACEERSIHVSTGLVVFLAVPKSGLTVLS